MELLRIYVVFGFGNEGQGRSPIPICPDCGQTPSQLAPSAHGRNLTRNISMLIWSCLQRTAGYFFGGNMRHWALLIACSFAATQGSAQTQVDAVPEGVRCIVERAGGSLSKATGDLVENRITEEQYRAALQPHLLACGQVHKWEYGSQRQSAMDFARSLGLIGYFGDRLRALKVSPASIVQLHDRMSTELRYVVSGPAGDAQSSALVNGQLQEFVKANSGAKTQPALGHAAAILRAEVQRREAISRYVRISEQIRKQNVAPNTRPTP